jgi:hypothetical protein
VKQLLAAWLFRVIKYVGNCAYVFERNLERGSPPTMERRQ